MLLDGLYANGLASARHVWLSIRPLNRDNVHTRCNLAARHRWGIEAGILVEKRCGYYAEHRLSYNWNATKAHHLLMRLAVPLNTLARFTRDLAPRIAARGMRPWIAFVRETFAAWPLDLERIAARLARPFQLRLQQPAALPSYTACDDRSRPPFARSPPRRVLAPPTTEKSAPAPLVAGVTTPLQPRSPPRASPRPRLGGFVRRACSPPCTVGCSGARR